MSNRKDHHAKRKNSFDDNNHHDHHDSTGSHIMNETSYSVHTNTNHTKKWRWPSLKYRMLYYIIPISLLIVMSTRIGMEWTDILNQQEGQLHQQQRRPLTVPTKNNYIKNGNLMNKERMDSSSSYDEEHDETAPNIHIVFSTGCTPGQDWQSYVFFYHVWKSGQRGNVTRIISGCKSKEEKSRIALEFQRSILNVIPDARQRFHIHFTPDYSQIHRTFNSSAYQKNVKNKQRPTYKFFNKPLGLKHWMEYRWGLTANDFQRTQQQQHEQEHRGALLDSKINNTILYILDPDQIILRPFTTIDYSLNSSSRMIWHGQKESWFLGNHSKLKIRPGYPFAQFYAMGNEYVKPVKDLNISSIMDDVLGRNSMIHPQGKTSFPLTSATANRYYNAGPPYIGCLADLYDIVTVWSNIVVPVYYLTDYNHLAEMYAYSTAAAYLNLPHQLSYSFMVSNPTVPRLEGWLEQGPGTASTGDGSDDMEYFLQWSDPDISNNTIRQYLPNVFHYCQEYQLGPYYFFKYYVPDDILTCSHPMLLEPSSSMKDTASASISNMEEKQRAFTKASASISSVSSRADCGKIAFLYNTTIASTNGQAVALGMKDHLILRRHAFSLCQMIYKMNDALEFWKQTNCNKIDLNASEYANFERSYSISKLRNAGQVSSPTKTSATASAANTATTLANAAKAAQKKFHLVFSTGCSVFQDWQSYAFFYHVWKSGQPGNVTRIVSGCSKSDEVKLRRVFQKQILDSIPTAIGRFHLHFTPDYSRILFDYGKEENPEEYKFFNKPLGLRHWMENRLGYTQDGSNPNDMNDTIIIILDPDQIILRPFTTNDFTSDTSAKWRGGGESWFLGKQKGLKVRKGLPFGQMYAYYAEWWDDVRGSISKIIEAINWKDEEYKTKNGLLTLTKDDINRYYIAGPPYLGVASDMYDIVSVWANVTIPVYYASKKDFLAEMFAYSVAAAYLRLPHQLASSFMASDPTAQPATEGWNDPPDHSPDANDNKDFLDWSNPSYDSQNLQLPNVFHYCQEYALGPYYFFKYFIPAGIMNCTHPLLLEPPSLLLQDGKGKLESTNESRANCGSIAFQYNSSISVHTDEALNYTDQLTIKRNAFSLCQMLYKLNDALDFWKQKNCAKGDNPNFARTYVFPVNKGAAILPSIPH